MWFNKVGLSIAKITHIACQTNVMQEANIILLFSSYFTSILVWRGWQDYLEIKLNTAQTSSAWAWQNFFASGYTVFNPIRGFAVI